MSECLEFVNYFVLTKFQMYLGHAKHFHDSPYDLAMIYSLEIPKYTHARTHARN